MHQNIVLRSERSKKDYIWKQNKTTTQKKKKQTNTKNNKNKKNQKNKKNIFST